MMKSASIIRWNGKPNTFYGYNPQGTGMTQAQIAEIQRLVYEYRRAYPKTANKAALEANFLKRYNSLYAKFMKNVEESKELIRKSKEIQRKINAQSPKTLSRLHGPATAKRVANLKRLNAEIRTLVEKTKKNIKTQGRINAEITKTVNNFFGRH